MSSNALIPQSGSKVPAAAPASPIVATNVVQSDISGLVAALASGYFGTIRRDEFKLENVWHCAGRTVNLSEEEVTRLLTDMQRAGFSKMIRRDLDHAISLVAKDNPFDSIKDWLSMLPPWDNVNRVASFLPVYFGTHSKPYSSAVGRYVWTAMVARILEPGCKVDMVPVLVGVQGVGKTTALSIIAPTPSHRDDATLTDRTSKLAYAAVGKTILVWEELQGIRGRVDADQVKTFITQSYVDVPTLKKGVVERYLRRFVIFGTSDRFEFLQDPAGDRRYLPFEVRKINHAKLEADKLQLWAEALAVVKERVQAGQFLVDFVDADRLAPSERRAFAKRAPWSDSKALIYWIQQQTTFFTTSDAMSALGIPPSAFSTNSRPMAASLRQLGCIQKMTRVPNLKGSHQRWHKV